MAVLFENDPPTILAGYHFELAGRLEQALSLPVDLIVMNCAPPDLVHRVLRDGLLVLELNASHRIRFEVCARNAYFDLLPNLREYRQTHGDVMP